MNKKSIILLIIIVIFGVLGFWAMIKFQGNANLNENQLTENINA